MRVLVLYLFFFFFPLAAHACDIQSRCLVEGGYYLAAEPENWDKTTPLALVVYFHGWNGSPEGTFKNQAMVKGVTSRNALFVAPFAQRGFWRQIGTGRAEGGRDEALYIRALVNSIKQHWPIDETQTLASGFSRGGSMVWNVACFTGDLFRAYAPIAGGFWGSTPDDCPTGPVNLRHIHGLEDRVVAFDEIGVYNSRPIPEGMSLLANVNRTKERGRKVGSGDPRLSCERWDKSASGHMLELCVHDGGHSIPAEWVAQGVDWMRALPDGS